MGSFVKTMQRAKRAWAVFAVVDAAYLIVLQPILTAIAEVAPAVAANAKMLPAAWAQVQEAALSAVTLEPLRTQDWSCWLSMAAIPGWILLLVLTIAMLVPVFRPPIQANAIADAQPTAGGGNEYGNAKWLRTPKDMKPTGLVPVGFDGFILPDPPISVELLAAGGEDSGQEARS